MKIISNKQIAIVEERVKNAEYILENNTAWGGWEASVLKDEKGYFGYGLSPLSGIYFKEMSEQSVDRLRNEITDYFYGDGRITQILVEAVCDEQE